MNWTEAQKQALRLGTSLSVTAGAGAGKTRVLTERYLRLLEADPSLSPANIVAITFTEKAAGEMRRRLHRALRERLDEEKSDRRRWDRIRMELPTAPISTIHAFCTQLLRQQALAARLDPEFGILEEFDANRLWEEAREDVFQELADQPPGSPERHAARLLLGEFGSRGLRKILETLLKQRGTARPWLDRVATWQQDEVAARLEEILEPVLDEKIAAFAARADVQEQIRVLATARCHHPDDALHQARIEAQTCLHDLFEGGPTPSRAGAIERLAGLNLLARSKRHWEPGDFDRCKEATKSFRGFAVELSRLRPTEFDLRALPIWKAIRLVFELTLARYDQGKAESGGLDFDDLLERTEALLSGNHAAAESCRQRYRAVLMDEVQDTNHVQWSIVRRMLPTSARGRLFIVGDPEQSIYGFQNAEVELFEQAKRQVIETAQGADVPMTDNFRSLAAPLDLVNRLFSGLMPSPAPSWAPPHQALRLRREGEGSVELLVPEAEGGGPEPHRAEAELVAARLRHLVEVEPKLVLDPETGQAREAGYGDVAILFSRRTHLRHYQRALRQASIPFLVLAGFGFYDTLEIRDITNLLRFLANPRHEVALLGILRSPFFGLSDDELVRLAGLPGESLWQKLADAEGTSTWIRDCLRRWLDQAGRVPVEQLLRRAFEETGVVAAWTAGSTELQAVANAEKLLSLVAARRMEGKSLREIVADLETLVGEERSESEADVLTEGCKAVRLLTIHAAKGLEFPVAVVPDLAASPRPNAGDVMVDKDLGVGLKLQDPSRDFAKQSTALHDAVTTRLKMREAAESRRLFYVAATRARDHLILSGNWQGSHTQGRGTWMDWLRMHLPISDDDLARGSVGFTSDGRAHRMAIYRDVGTFGPPPEPAPARAMVERAKRALAEPNPAERVVYDRIRRQRAPLSGEPRPAAFSVTAIGEFLRCPWRYYWRYCLSVPEPDVNEGNESDAELRGRRTVALAIGNAAHRVFERLPCCAPGKEEELIRSALRDEGALSEEDRVRIAAELLKGVRDFRDSELGRAALGASERYREVPFAVKLGPGVLTGKIDLLFTNREGRRVVLDYKTNRIEPPDVPAVARRYEDQMTLYALATSKLFGQSDVQAVLIFTHIGQAHECHFGPAALSEAESSCRSTIERIQAQDWQTLAQIPCPIDDCSFRHLCDKP